MKSASRAFGMIIEQPRSWSISNQSSTELKMRAVMTKAGVMNTKPLELKQRKPAKKESRKTSREMDRMPLPSLNTNQKSTIRRQRGKRSSSTKNRS